MAKEAFNEKNVFCSFDLKIRKGLMMYYEYVLFCNTDLKHETW